MMDETKKLIKNGFTQSTDLPEYVYRTWYAENGNIGISEEKSTGKVEFNFDFFHDDERNWISEEDGLRRMRLKAFW